MKFYKWFHPLLSGWKSKSLWKGFLWGLGIYYLRGLPFPLWHPKTISLAPEKRRKISVCGYSSLWFSEASQHFCFSWHQSSGEGVDWIAQRAYESPGKKGPETETFNSFSMKFKIGNLPGMDLMKGYRKGKVTKNLQSLRISQESDHFSPPTWPPWSGISLSLLDYWSHLLIVLPTQPLDTNTLCSRLQQSNALTTWKL